MNKHRLSIIRTRPFKKAHLFHIESLTFFLFETRSQNFSFLRFVLFLLILDLYVYFYICIAQKGVYGEKDQWQ